jgi:4-hydroxythreonine-4-phosphate dehydrogenase
MLFQEAAFSVGLPFRFLPGLGAPSRGTLSPEILEVHEVGDPRGVELFAGTVNSRAGRVAFQSIERGIKLAMERRLDAIVTPPISKESIRRAGYPYPGHTQILADLTKSPRYAMMFAAPGLRVVLATTHIPYTLVPRHLSRSGIVDKIELASESMRRDFSIRNPSVAVLALNPHAGEGGLFGREERTLISPAINEAQERKIDAAGPFPADSWFSPGVRRDYDVVVAMYHDQGLIPLKALYPGRTVNVTLGLPIVRTSPDHGTAFNIAGKGIADSRSMIEAILLAIKMAGKRKRLD